MSEPDWLGLVDPDGVRHCLGDITETADYTECGLEFATSELGGWNQRAAATQCAVCAEAEKHHVLSPVRIVTSREEYERVKATEA